MDYAVRLATEEDFEAVGRITVSAYCDDGFIDADDDYVKELGDAARRARESEIWVAEDSTGVLGSVTFCAPGSAFAELSRGNEGEFRMLGVAGHSRRRGVAEALVARCIERSRELGFDALVLSSMRQMTDAHRLYERLGFRRVPERDWSPVEGIELLGFSLRLD